MFNINCC